MIRNATILTITKGTVNNGSIWVHEGKIQEIGATVRAPADAKIIDGSGRFVMPGIIDSHSHSAISGGVNESGPSVTANCRITDVLQPDDINLYRAAAAGVTTDTIAKYLFTSGSTGMPKCVPQAHKMMTAVIAGAEALADRPREERVTPISLDWMPWSHISGGNIFFNGNIWAGGTMYLDEGRPVPGLFETTIKNLYEVSPVVFGWAIDATGRWDVPFIGSLAFLLIGTALAFTMKPDQRFVAPGSPDPSPTIATRAAA